MHLTQHLFISYLMPGQGRFERRDRILVTLAGIAPDVDAPILLAFGKDAFIQYHHDFTHHLLGAALAAAAAWFLGRKRAAVAALAAAAWCGHLLLDMIGAGERELEAPFAYAYPLPLLWPFSDRPFDPFSFSWTLASWQNAVVMAAAILLMARLAVVEGRTVLEVFSLRLDAAVVKTLRARFRRHHGAGDELPPADVH